MEKFFKKFEPKEETVLIKMNSTPHPLSAELQQFYVELTEGCLNFSETVRHESLMRLNRDNCVKYIAGYLCDCLRDTIHMHLAFPDLNLLTMTLRMAKSLVSNPHVNLKPYLHIVLPAILSCIVGKKLAEHQYENHWITRELAVNVITTICNIYNNDEVDRITIRVCGVYLKSIKAVNVYGFGSLYGAIKGLEKLGENALETYLIPHINNISPCIANDVEKLRLRCATDIEVKKVMDLICNLVPPILFNNRLKYRHLNSNEDFLKHFGYLGYYIYMQV